MTDEWRHRPRRRYAPEFKAQVVTECRQPGASVAAVALAHGINANVVHKWLRGVDNPAPLPVTAFVPVAVQTDSEPAPPIRIELRQGATAVNIAWPVAAAAECASWLRELLK